LNATAERPAPAASSRTAWLLLAFVGIALWALLIQQLQLEWNLNPQYSYGLGMPLLAAYLAYRRWGTRPEPAPPAQLGSAIPWLVVLALLWLPIRLFQEANPDWRPVSWALGFNVAALTLLGLWSIGGRPWLRHFAFPVLFMLLAVPWPTEVEKGLIQTLMRVVAAITVELLAWFGIPARPQGNLIELATGVVGINEACSGVRSFQSTLMIALFLGEMNRLNAARRLVLLASGIATAFLFNVIRTFFLTWQCAQHGTQAANAWHDPAGYVVFGASFVCLLGIAWLLKRRGNADANAENDGSKSYSPGSTWVGAARPVPVMIVAALGAWLLLAEAGTLAWYRLHEARVQPQPGWTVAWPQQASGYRALPISQEVQRILRHSRGDSALWQPAPGREWQAFFFRWDPGRAAASLARNHTPDICLPASGLKLVRELAPTVVPANGVSIPFRTFLFESRGGPLHVFYCVWEDRPAGNLADASRSAGLDRTERTRAVLEGRRNRGQQVLEIAIRGPLTPEQAQQELAAGLQQIVRPVGS
jgi:exosortase